MAALRIWMLPALMGIGQILAWPIGPGLLGQPPSVLDSAVAVVVTAVVAVALGWRRRAPEVVLAVIVPTLAAGTIALPADVLSVIAFADLVALFSLAILRSARIVAVAVTLLLVGWTVVITIADTPDPQVIVPLVAILYVLVAALGRRRGRWQRARAAAAARLVVAEAAEQRAAEVERDRLARELHDVTAHHLTAVVVHADAARRLAAARPELVAETLSFAAETGRTTLTALDRLVTVIEPSLEPLAERLARVAAAAPEVTVEVTGPAGTLPPPVADTVLAVVQEGVTNAMRYAAGAPVSAVVEVVAVEVRVAVRNPPAGDAALSGPLGSGRGLAGLAARARELNGTFDAGPCPVSGGWTVQAAVPLRATPRAVPLDRRVVTSERILDGALTALALLPPALVLVAAVDTGGLRDVRVGVLLALLALLHGAPVWWRRVAPWPALAAVLGAALAHAAIVAAARLPVEAVWPLFAGLFAEVITVWAVATYARPAVVAWTGALATGGVWSLVIQLIGDGDQGIRRPVPVGRFAVEVNTRALLFTALLLVLVWALAAVLRRRRERTLEAEAAALHAAAARAAAAARDQRARFAAGLHASVLEPAQRLIAAAEAAPRLAAAAPRSAAPRLSTSAVAPAKADVHDRADREADGAAGLAALDRVAAEARAGLAAMRELLGVLQPVPAGDPGAPPRGTAGLAELCAERRLAGRSVILTVATAPVPLPVAVDLSGYRIVDVALDTQDAAEVTVSVAYPGDGLSITVAGVPSATTGIPAARIRARVAALGGRVRLDPAGLVEVHLPVPADEDPKAVGPAPDARSDLAVVS
jgi:signal transduction histidine kinase